MALTAKRKPKSQWVGSARRASAGAAHGRRGQAGPGSSYQPAPFTDHLAVSGLGMDNHNPKEKSGSGLATRSLMDDGFVTSLSRDGFDPHKSRLLGWHYAGRQNRPGNDLCDEQQDSNCDQHCHHLLEQVEW
jgi:hypothetical protein